ncbi:MAG: hypothetical protein GY866_43115, partial [Proteobacteria bacterium]|nr:hypothetical protein [Pseudomonadota bacterium]
SLAGSVGGGQQTPGFMGIGKVFLTSKKFLFAEGGVKRLVWMPKELKEQLGPELQSLFEEQGAPDLFEKIADETVATEAHDVRTYLENVGHPSLEMGDMDGFAESETDHAPTANENDRVSKTVPETPDDQTALEDASTIPPETDTAGKSQTLTPDLIEQIKQQITQDISRDLKTSITQEIVRDIIGTLGSKFLGEQIGDKEGDQVPETSAPETETEAPQILESQGPTAEERIGAI